MKALVTGSAGFIGSHLVDALLADPRYDRVIGVDNLSAGTLDNLSNALKNKNFTNVECDVCSKNIGELFEGVDVIFHEAASKKNICLKDPHKDLEVNAGGTLNLLQNCIKHGVKKFVHASTGSVYGEPTVFPQTENHPLNPCSFYGVSKLAGERYVSMFNQIYGLDTTILRYFHVFGSKQDNTQDKGGVVAIFMDRIKHDIPITVFGTGTQERSFTHVSDIVRANLFVSDKAKGETFNVASGIKVSINKLIDYLELLNKKPCKVERDARLIGDIDRFDVSNDKLRKAGFKFKALFEGELIEMWRSL